MLNRDLLVFQRPLLTFARSSSERMIIISICAALAVLQSAWQDGGHSLLIAAAACAGALAAELLFNFKKRGFALKDSSCIVSALVLSLFLPNTINPVFAALGAIFAIAVVKHCFGGLGANWFNPALGGWLFIRASWPDAFNSALENSALTFISSWTMEETGGFFSGPVSILAKNGFGAQNGDIISAFLNKNLFYLFDIEIPAGYFDFFISPGPGLIADRGLLALIAGSIIMVSTMVSRTKLSVFFIAVFMCLVRIAGALPFGGGLGQGDMLHGLFSGGVLAASLFIALEPSTGPKSGVGRLIYVFLAALLTFFIRYVKNEGCAVMFGFAALNILSPIFRMIEERLYYERAALRSKL